MKKYILFGKHLCSYHGGAEISLLTKFNKVLDQCLIVGLNKANKLNKFDLNLDSKICNTKINNKYDFKYFSKIEYLLNKNSIINFFENIPSNLILHSYSLSGIASCIGFKGKSFFYVRSQNDILYNDPKEFSQFNFLKKIYKKIENENLLVKSDFLKLLERSQIIVNSKFVYSTIEKLYGYKSIIEYPIIDKKILFNNINSSIYKNYKKGIVFVGDGYGKGEIIFQLLADYFNNETFYHFTRYSSKKTLNKNIILLPWGNKIGDYLACAKLVIIPSQWAETYGRVARETYISEVPVLVSNTGGLPETVDYKEDLIVNDYQNINSWITLVKRKL